MLPYFYGASFSKEDKFREHVIFGEQILQDLIKMASIHILFAL